MTVGVRLQAILRRYRPAGFKGDVVSVEVPDGATARDAAERLGVPENAIHAVFVNDRQAALDTILSPGDVVRLFPPVAGGAGEKDKMRVFIAGIMQGSRRDTAVVSQDYRQTIATMLQARVPGVQILDPWALHPNSVSYDNEQGKRTFLELCDLASTADVLVAYVPEASMGTAIEIWQAFQAGAYVISISPLADNWVVKFLSQRVVRGLDDFEQFVSSGEFEGVVRSHRERAGR